MTPNHTQNSVPVDPNRKKLVWKEAATGGLYLGLALVAVMVISYLGRMDATLSWVPGLLNFAALVLFILFYARKVSHYYASTGFYYPQSLAFILKMMLFAGVLAGVGQFILQNYVDPGYYTSVIETTLKESGFKEEDINLTMETGVMRNPIVMALSGAISMLLYGGMIGLVVSAFVKRPPAAPAPKQEPDPSDSNPGNSTSHGND
ncbi:MAG: DUF4199 domain-containing protein [Alistipes indistinctus]|jgi:flagellar biosynthesis protein FliQ|uniref:DUF4199 domain-containing protein n=1 Tax=Alistipes indistinctus TaxID=626932 RepID=UPI00241F59BF|nr:DUF4199 domain-containing protein [Alistipes indistinctus]MBD9135635.1 DUF4199 domain-containing protein [Alistipes indistinctus]